MTKADKPASSHKVVHGGAQLPAYTFDILMMEAFKSCNKEWLCFVQGVTNVDLDDNKINKYPQSGSCMVCSHIQLKKRNWSLLFIQQPWLEPVWFVHWNQKLLAWSSGKCWDLWSSIFHPLINHPCKPCSLSSFDQGYFEISKVQTGVVTNLIKSYRRWMLNSRELSKTILCFRFSL